MTRKEDLINGVLRHGDKMVSPYKRAMPLGRGGCKDDEFATENGASKLAWRRRNRRNSPLTVSWLHS